MAKKLNPDENYVTMMYDSIEKNNGHCPCIINKSEETICPCKDFQVKDICHCQLFID